MTVWEQIAVIYAVVCWAAIVGFAACWVRERFEDRRVDREALARAEWELAVEGMVGQFELLTEFAADVQDKADELVSPDVLAEVVVGWSKTHEESGL